MSKTHRHILFTIEPVKPRNRIAMEGLKRRGGPHVKPYGSLRQNNKQALRRMLDEDEHEEKDERFEVIRNESLMPSSAALPSQEAGSAAPQIATAIWNRGGETPA